MVSEPAASTSWNRMPSGPKQITGTKISVAHTAIPMISDTVPKNRD